MLKRKNVRFSDKKHSVRGIISFLMSVISILLLGIVFYFSSLAKGEGGSFLGGIGLIILIFSLAGFILAIKAYKEKDIYYHTPILGSIFNGTIFIVLFILYIMGLFL